MNKIPVIVLSLLIGVSSLWTQQIKMIVKVDRAVIYAEPNENSYKIDTVNRGTVLTLFQKGIDSSHWIYVTFDSRRWKGKVTGFIRLDQVVTEEEILREEQRRLEEKEQKQKAGAVVQDTAKRTKAEMEVEAEAKPKHQEELPDMREAFVKKKAEEKAAVDEAEVKKPELAPEEKQEVKESELPPIKPEPAEDKPEEKEIVDRIPQAEEIAIPETKLIEEEEFKKPEPPPPMITVRDGITESPSGRKFTLPQIGEMAETTPYAIIKRELEPPPSQLKDEQIVQKAQAELKTDVLAMKTEEPPPDEEEMELLEETPQVKAIARPETEIAAEREFKRPEPPPPIVTVMDVATDSPRNRALLLEERVDSMETMVYEFIELEIPEPDTTGEKTEESQEPVQVVKPPEQVIKSMELPPSKQLDDVELLSLGFGYGPIYGGLGGAVQVNVNDNIAIHIGGGIYPTRTYYSEYAWATNEWLYSIGIKYYLPFESATIRPYVDLMFGGICVEAVQLVKEIWYYEYTFENIQKTLYGPSLVAGADMKLGFLGLNGYLGLSFNTTAWDYWDRDYFLNGGLGFSLLF